MQPRMISNGVNEGEACTAAGADQVRGQYVPWVPVRKCAGHRPAPRVTRSEHRPVRNSPCPTAGTAVGSSSSPVVSTATPGKNTPAASPCNCAKAAGVKAATLAPATVVRAVTTTRAVAALDLAPPSQSCAPAVTEPVASEKTSKSRQTPRQLPTSKQQPQPPPMPPPRPVPRRRARAMLARADQMFSRVLHRSPGGAKALQRKPALETVEQSASISLSCIEQLEEDASSSSDDEELAKGLELGASCRDGQTSAMRTNSAPALLVTSCLRGSGRCSADERKNRRVSWRTREASIILVSPRSVDQARWACSLESTPLNASLLSGEDDLEQDAAHPPSIPPPPACGESEIDVLKAALEVSLSLEPNHQGSGSDDEAEELDPEDELDASEIWVGVERRRPRGQVGLPCVGLPCHTAVFVGDENDPGAANRPSSAPLAWPPKKPFANALTGSSPNFAATLRMPARNRLAVPLGLREA